MNVDPTPLYPPDPSSQTEEPMEETLTPAISQDESDHLEGNFESYLEESESVSGEEFTPNQESEMMTFPVIENEVEQGEILPISSPIETEETPENETLKSSLIADLEVLEKHRQSLQEEIAILRADKLKAQEELIDSQNRIVSLIREGLNQLEQRRQSLQIEVDKLERRRDRIQKEMRTTFAGVSQDLAIRVQGFKDYLVGSLQELVSTAEQLELTPPPVIESPKTVVEESRSSSTIPTPKFAEQGFQEQAKQIRRILDQYRTLPDYYGPPWQLRRTFEPIHAEKVSNWFFTQGGRGALRTMGSRLQNILIASTVISVLRTIYGGRLRTLVLVNTPERMGEWRRGLQDCLGITRADFGPERGLILFEASEPLIQKADRLVKEGKLPLILIDEMEEQVNLSLLQFPLWLAFAPDPQTLIPKERDF